MSRLSSMWVLMLRLSVAGFWLFFASQRWFNRGWVEELFTEAASGNYIPFYGNMLRELTASWEVLTLTVTALETAVGVMFLVGLYPRIAAVIGTFIAANLWLTFSFCDCLWNRQDPAQVFWFYYSALLLNLAILREKNQPSIIRHRRK
ncbi:MAG: DoxX family membrane protein [Nitrososphaerota archaeon]